MFILWAETVGIPLLVHSSTRWSQPMSARDGQNACRYSQESNLSWWRGLNFSFGKSPFRFWGSTLTMAPHSSTTHCWNSVECTNWSIRVAGLITKMTGDGNSNCRRSHRAARPFFIGFSVISYTRGSASIPTPSDSSPIRTLPAIPVRQNSRGCTIRFMLRPAVLASTPGWVRPVPILGTSRLGTLSGQVQPVCHHTNPPPAYTSKRATDVTTSFQVARYRSRDLAL